MGPLLPFPAWKLKPERLHHRIRILAHLASIHRQGLFVTFSSPPITFTSASIYEHPSDRSCGYHRIIKLWNRSIAIRRISTPETDENLYRQLPAFCSASEPPLTNRFVDSNRAVRFCTLLRIQTGPQLHPSCSNFRLVMQRPGK